ncbi:MAG: Omp28-related outer membrane protein [Bacteroidaceae bacterium]|nr:Omp28-related outer membrane protein [Bacteroidaceae bacterium]
MKKFLLIPLLLCGMLAVNAQPLSKLQKFCAKAVTEDVQKAQTPLTGIQKAQLQMKKSRASLEDYAVNPKELTNNDPFGGVYYAQLDIANTMSVGTLYTTDMAERFSGNKITAIYSAVGTGVQSATFWIKKSLNGESLWETTITDFTPNKIFGLECDYTIDDEAFILGYTIKGNFTQGSLFFTENPGKLSMIVADENGNWMDYSSNGSTFFVCETEGEAGLQQNDLAITDASISDRAMVGANTNIVGQLTNYGSYPVVSFKTKVVLDDKEIISEHEVDTTLHRGIIEFSIPATAPATPGCYARNIEVIEVNGAADGFPNDNKVKTQLLALSESYPRKVVMEEFTGTWCGWCPRGMAAIEKLQSDYPNDFIAIGVHASDNFEAETYYPILNTAAGFPSALINRVVEADPYYGLSENNYGIKELVELVKELPTEAQIGVSSKLSADKSEIEFSSYSRFNISVDNMSAYVIAYALIEDGLMGVQTNYYSKSMASQTGFTEANLPAELLPFYNQASSYFTTYNDVARGIYDAWGIEGSLSGTVQSGKAKAHTYTIPMPAEIQNPDNVSVVAMLMDAYTGEIIAAEKAKLGEEKLTAIGTITKNEMNADIAATEGAVIVTATNATAKVYTIDGKLLATQSVNGIATIPTNGWSGTIIVRVENGNDVVVKKINL